MKYDTQRPYAASYVIVRNQEGDLAFVLRSNTSWMNGYYSLPSGKTEIGEPFSLGAIREAKEEIGIDIVAEDLKQVLVVHRFSPKNPESKDSEDMEWVDVYFEVKKYKGRVHNAEPHMHSKVAWLDPNNLPDEVIPSVNASIAAYLTGKNYLEYGYEK